VVQILRAAHATNRFNMLDSSIRLCGKFKFDVYNRDGSLDYSAEQGNFITPSGLSYINDYAIADCFRYLSVGTGSGQNTVLSGGTTGLHFPLTGSGYSYVGGNQVTSCGNRRGNQYFSGGCGIELLSSGLSLIRSWRIRSNGYFSEDKTLREYMLSPGIPTVPAYSFGLTGLCHCNESAYISTGETGATVGGIESFDFYQRYPNICSATKAFSRVLKNVSILQNQYLVVKYSLLVTLNTGVKTFYFENHRDNVYDGINNESIFNWSGTSGRYSLIHYGLKAINSGDVLSRNIPQINNEYQFRLGESYIPINGIPLEPSCPIINRMAYISSDNTSAIVNETGGIFMNTGLYLPFNPNGKSFPSGVIYFSSQSIKNLSQSLTFLRRTGTSFPSPDNFTKTTTNFYEPYPRDSRFGSLNVVNSGCSDKFVFTTGRNRWKVLAYQFAEPALPSKFPVRAFVMGYKYDKNQPTVPALDMIFSPKNLSGNFYQDIILDIKQNSALANIYFPTGLNQNFVPAQASQFDSRIVNHNSGYRYVVYGPNPSQSILIPENTGVADLGYFVTTKHFDYFINPLFGNQNDIATYFADYTNVSSVQLTGYMVSKSQAQVSGVIWTGLNPIPSEAIPITPSYISQTIAVKSGFLETFTYSGRISLSSLFIASGALNPDEYRVIFTGFYLGEPIYVTRTALYDSAIAGGDRFYNLEARSSFSGISELGYSGFRYSIPSGMIIKNPTYSGGYSYMDENNILLMQFALNWSAPCPSGVIGC